MVTFATKHLLEVLQKEIPGLADMQLDKLVLTLELNKPPTLEVTSVVTAFNPEKKRGTIEVSYPVVRFKLVEDV